MSNTVYAALASVLLLTPALPLRAAGPLRVMILDGQSAGTYHDWRHTTPVLKKELEDAGLFQVGHLPQVDLFRQLPPGRGVDVLVVPDHPAGQGPPADVRLLGPPPQQQLKLRTFAAVALHPPMHGEHGGQDLEQAGALAARW